MIDIGANLTHESFNKDRSEVIQAAVESGVKTMIVTGSNMDCSRQAFELTQLFPEQLYSTVGIHPHHASDYTGETEDLILELIQHDKVVAIGETGLDYFYQQDNSALQQQAFIAHLRLSKRLAKPVIVHTRSANEDTLRLLREEADQDVGGVIHCFTEDWTMAEACLDLGFYISISGIVTFNSANDLREVVKKIPMQRLLVETDAPYLAPVPHRGQQNEPKHVRLVAQYIADLKGVSLAELATQTSQNFTQLFLSPQ